MSDLISRQAAIDAVAKDLNRGTDPLTDLFIEGISETLRKVPTAQPEKRTEKHTETHSCDLISRDAVLDCFHCWVDRHGDVHEPDEMPEYRAIEALPTIQPKKGKWIRIVKHHKDAEQEYSYYEISCSECGAIRKIGWRDARFCPNCGAEMRGGEDEC